MITKEQFGEWRQHPATRVFWQFIRDLRKSRTDEAMTLFIGGTFGDAAHLLRGHILQLLMIEELTFDLIQSFYQELNNADTANIERVS